MSRKKQPGEPTNGYGDNKEVDIPADYRAALADLTPFQRRFVEAGLKSDSWADAARIAGSTAENLEQVAWNTRKIEKVQKALALGMLKRVEAAALDDNEVIMKFRDVFDKAMEAGDYGAANKASENLGKILGLFDGTSKVDAKIAGKAREIRSQQEADREGQVDEATATMLDMLNDLRMREGSPEDPRYDTLKALTPEQGEAP